MNLKCLSMWWPFSGFLIFIILSFVRSRENASSGSLYPSCLIHPCIHLVIGRIYCHPLSIRHFLPWCITLDQMALTFALRRVCIHLIGNINGRKFGEGHLGKFYEYDNTRSLDKDLPKEPMKWTVMKAWELLTNIPLFRLKICDWSVCPLARSYPNSFRVMCKRVTRRWKRLVSMDSVSALAFPSVKKIRAAFLSR